MDTYLWRWYEIDWFAERIDGSVNIDGGGKADVDRGRLPRPDKIATNEAGRKIIEEGSQEN